MDIADFGTEHFFDKYEFVAEHQLCNSDCESLSVQQLFDLAGTDLAELTDLRLGYTEATGRPELRKLIAESYSSVEVSDVVVTNSPVEGLYLCARSLLEVGDEVITLGPCYEALINPLSQVVGDENVRQWDLVAEESSWSLPIEDLEKLITERTKLLVINFPHNPTGFVPVPGLYSQIFDLAAANGLWVLSDEMYSQLALEGECLPQAVDVYEKAISLCGLSKSEGLPGIRAGWLVVKDPALRHRIVNWKFYTSNCPNTLTEVLSIAALKARHKLVARSVEQIRSNLEIAGSFFKSYSDRFIWRSPVGGPVALVEMPETEVSVYADELAKDKGILILPGHTFGASDSFWRIGLGRKAFPNALEAFGAHLKNE